MKISDITDFLKQKRVITAVNILLALLVTAAILLLIRDIVSIAIPLKEKKTRTMSRPKDSAQKNLQDYAPILTNNPFGFAAGELKPIAASSGPSVSRTDIILIGTVAGRRDLSYAIFADKTGQQDVFRAGEQVFGLGRLSRVEKARVFINSNGKETEISLKDITDIREIKPPEGQAPSSASFGRRVGESSYQIDQQRVQQAIEKPDQIMTDARFVPNIVDGKQQGFVLREVKPGGIYSSLGLQNGDILLRINEFNISNPETALQAFTTLRGIDRAQLDVIRNGSKMTMTYQIR
jgi:general secretion pathway protein C